MSLFKKGNVPWNKGRKCPNISKSLFGKKLSKEHRINISKGHKGQIPWNKGNISAPVYCPDCGKETYKYSNKCRSCTLKGISLSEEHKRNLSLSLKGRKAWNIGIKSDICGENHYNWQGGKSFEPYGLEFNNQLKEQIRRFYHYRCQQCFRHQEELKRKLSIHHIDYNKKNNHPNNLIPLCDTCHMQTNFKRDDWSNYFQEKVIEGDRL